MQKERLMAIFIGSSMLMSILGFSLINTRFSNPQQNRIDFPHVINRELTSEEIVSVLRSGRVIVEDIYEANCTECIQKNQFLESFFQDFSDFVVLEIVEGNETSLNIIGSGGRIRDISNMPLNQSSLMDVFCDMAIAQPRECLLEQI